MHLHPTQYRNTLAALVLTVLAGSTGLAQMPPPQPLSQGQPTPRAQTAPATQPPAYTTKMFPLDAKVQDVLDKARQAYGSLQSYQDLGSATTTMTVQGRTQESTSPAATTFERPDRFVASHEAMNLYSDGRTLWLYMAARGRYLQTPLPEAMSPAGPAGLQVVLRNLPALSMLLTPDASLLATKEAYQSQYRGQEKLGNSTVHHITLSVPATGWFGPAASQPTANPSRVLMDAYFDIASNTLLRLNLNMTEAMKNYYTNIQGPERAPELSQVVWQFNAGNIRLNAPIPDETFVFKVPAEAEQVDTYAALTSNAPGRQPINDEEEAERAEAEEARLPYLAPDLTLPDLSGQDIKLSDHRGKVVLLDFWATWCGPCRAALPGILRLHNDLAGKGLQVVAVDIGEDLQTVLAFAEKNKMVFQVLVDEQDKVSQLYKVSAIPKTFLINRNGQVVKIFTGLTPEPIVRAAVESVLATPAASQPAGTQPAARTAAQPVAAATRPATE